ncbi:hypothetical protein T492DRAFT_1007184 [Pavlovales sp. CCMP2436]|nr:hypothetical protein T492DRAFT_1007184 [Pavlovales sp. CCMP2436]
MDDELVAAESRVRLSAGGPSRACRASRSSTVISYIWAARAASAGLGQGPLRPD